MAPSGKCSLWKRGDLNSDPHTHRESWGQEHVSITPGSGRREDPGAHYSQLA